MDGRACWIKPIRHRLQLLFFLQSWSSLELRVFRDNSAILAQGFASMNLGAFFVRWCHACLCIHTADDSASTEAHKKRRKKELPSQLQSSATAIDIKDRLASFSDCRTDKEILNSYATAGFSYKPDSGYIYCGLCGLTLTGLIKSATHGDPLSLHRIHKPYCKLLLTKDRFHRTIEQHEGHGKIEDHSAWFCFCVKNWKSDSIPFGFFHYPIRNQGVIHIATGAINTIALDHWVLLFTK